MTDTDQGMDLEIQQLIAQLREARAARHQMMDSLIGMDPNTLVAHVIRDNIQTEYLRILRILFLIRVARLDGAVPDGTRVLLPNGMYGTSERLDKRLYRVTVTFETMVNDTEIVDVYVPRAGYLGLDMELR